MSQEVQRLAVQDLLRDEDRSADPKQTEDPVVDPKDAVHLVQDLSPADTQATKDRLTLEIELVDHLTKTAILRADPKGQTPNPGMVKQRINSKTKEIGRLVRR